jgi:uncharacterized protein (DUF1330 family)
LFDPVPIADHIDALTLPPVACRIAGCSRIEFAIAGQCYTLAKHLHAPTRSTCPDQSARFGSEEGRMAVFYIGTYDIVDPNEFEKYPPLVLALLPKYGGVVLASDTSAVLVEGSARTMNAIIRFPSKEAALGLYNDSAYQEAKRIRQASTKNVSMVLVEEFKNDAS